jgi:hypothetical protein
MRTPVGEVQRKKVIDVEMIPVNEDDRLVRVITARDTVEHLVAEERDAAITRS